MRLDSYKTYIAPRLAQFRQHLRRPARRTVLLALAALPALFLLYLLLLIPFTPGISDIRKAKSEQPAQVLSADGKELAVYRWANRDWVKLADISPNVVNALIATEDHRFYQHFGLDWRRTASAALHTFSGDRQGGSTITQQLARNRYPDDIGRAPMLTRKLKEAITALKIEALYSKDEILETYLNTVPFLYNAFGIEMAARTYFDKSARQLDVLEAATLIGMLKGNSYYNPVLNPQRALERRNIVLAQMVKRGKLDAARFQALSKRPLRIDFERQVEEPGPAAHFAQQLRKWLISWADSNDYNLYTDGLVIHTTIDARLQAMANQALARQGNQLQSIANAAWAPRAGWAESRGLVQQFVRETPEYRAAVAGGQTDADALNHLMRDNAFMLNLRQTKTRVQAGFMALDPATGEIRAWVGSRDFTVDAFDHVAQARRQPGSTFKPFVYGAAFARGQSPDETFIDQPVEIKLAGGEIWRPTDESAATGRAMSLRDGLVYSKNTITAQLVQTLGADRVARLARAMGVRDSKLEEVPSLALGTSPVTLKEMVTAYGTIANGGQYIAPSMITRITDRNGKELARFRAASPERALSATANETLLDVMRDVVDRGTGTAIRTRYGIRADVAGKTGTTQDNADGWFILMHPQLVAGAWVGFNDSRVTLRSDYWGQGAHSALPIVGDFYQRALRARIVDPRARFAEVDEKSWYSGLTTTVRGWYQKLFASNSKDDSVPVPRPAPRRPVLPATDADAMPPASAPATASSSDNGLALDPGEVVEAVPSGGHELEAPVDASTAQGEAPVSAPAAASAPAAL
ncbi:MULTISPECIES: transglycosylase domain-containing protein [unclassified Cupriavidus]|uniref:penicillin-binding protein 1A n=1 Tax=unclassified Cupriavidus TaxID=2640874 RepID=UPI001C0026E1|nr:MULTISPECIES: transglycosylase domain-containing protein [unclassified Cupriavidus]MCA3188170.1 transglycosylase domain-containing protein [Cupriavidus sp.]MCA3190708.1 transglycosylase domain-containing protein [Cupriavidus sp.]MCA3199205.1 transglycosylase domain-containing protein [Cupriavidus sp.]MCA3205142.1 transglycosylase domain-containing protein [Cupriavidus sp.]MCA3205828.1 transglycosylase domain-containing protein [Cupriavidus sp.]